MNQIQEYVKRLFNADDGTSATIVITILVFGIGQLIISLSKAIERFNNRINTRKMFEAIVMETIKLAKKESKAHFNKIGKLYLTEKKDFNATKSEFYQLEVMRQLGFQKSYESIFNGIENSFSRYFRKTDRLKAFIKIWDVLNSIEYWEQRSFEDSLSINDLYNVYNEKRNNALRGFMNIVEKILFAAKNNLLEGAMLQYASELDKILVRWQGSPDRVRPRNINRLLVVPLRRLNKTYSASPLIAEMTSHLLDASLQYQNIYNMFAAKRIQFRYYSIFFKYDRRAMEVSLNRLKRFKVWLDVFSIVKQNWMVTLAVVFGTLIITFLLFCNG